MKLAKMILTGTMLLVPALAMGIAQQDPAQPAEPNLLQQDQAAAAQPGMEQEIVGTISEVRDDSFSVTKDSDQSVVWFSITPELKSSYAAELVTGNHVRVKASAGDSPDRMAAVSVMAEAGGGTTADSAIAEPDTQADLDADADTETDLDADIAVDEDSTTATLDSDTEVEDTDTQIAQTETDTSLREDETTYDDTADDELPQTASSLPAIGVLGLLAVVGAAAFALVRKF